MVVMVKMRSSMSRLKRWLGVVVNHSFWANQFNKFTPQLSRAQKLMRGTHRTEEAGEDAPYKTSDQQPWEKNHKMIKDC